MRDGPHSGPRSVCLGEKSAKRERLRLGPIPTLVRPDAVASGNAREEDADALQDPEVRFRMLRQESLRQVNEQQDDPGGAGNAEPPTAPPELDLVAFASAGNLENLAEVIVAEVVPDGVETGMRLNLGGRLPNRRADAVARSIAGRPRRSNLIAL